MIDKKYLENILIICTDVEVAELVFLDKCAEYFTNWDEYTEEDKEAILDDGYEESAHKIVFISWPEVQNKKF